MGKRSFFSRARPVVEELEARVLYSADAMAAMLQAHGIEQGAEVRSLDEYALAPIPAAHAEQEEQDEFADTVIQAQHSELIIIDSRVPDAQRLADDLMRQRDAGTAFDIVFLDASQDGVAQISQALAGRSGLTAIHIISHGSDGVIELGNSRLDGARLSVDAASVARWGQALTGDGDLLLYGCDVAQSDAGRAFVDELARLTGADVAASFDATGNNALGGNWSLEYASGAIETGLAIGAQAQQQWGHVLAISVDTTTVSGKTLSAGATSLTLSKTVNAGANGMLVVNVAWQANSGSILSVTYGGTALTLLGTATNGGGVTTQTSMYYLKAPAVGTADVVVSMSEIKTFTVGATNYFGVEQGASFGSFVAASGANTAPSVVVAAAGNDLVIDSVAGRSSSTADVGLLQTEAFRQNTGATGADVWGSSSRENGAASVTMSWTLPGNGFTEWAIGAVALKPATNTAPTLDATKTPVLADQFEDAGAPTNGVAAGTLVSSLVDFATPTGQVDNVTDPDVGAQLGIAVTAANTTNGSWWYSLNNGGNWSTLGAVLPNNARLLAADELTRIYFQPSNNYSGTVTSAITFRAWDRSAGNINGALVNAQSNGGNKAFSNATDTANITVTPVNDAPVLDTGGTMTLTAINDNDYNNSGTTVAAIILSATGDRITDVDGPAAVEGIAIFATVNGNGSWQYSIDTGTTWVNVGTVATNSALLLSDTDLLRFLPTGNATSGSVSFRAWDQTSGTPGVKVDPAGGGATSAFSTATRSAAITVNAANDAPINIVPATQTVVEDSVLIFSLTNGNQIAISDVDAGTSDVQTTLTVRHGTLTLATLSGLSFSVGDGTADRTMTFKGELTEINPALNGLRYNPDSHFAGPDSLTIVTEDLGNTGSGGNLSDADLLVINVTPDAINDAPTVTVPGAQNMAEDGVLVFAGTGLNPIQINDDAGNNPIQVTLSANFGSLFISNTSGLETVVNTNLGGTQNQVQAAVGPGGGVVVVWTSNNQDGSGEGVYGQRFDSAGLRLGAEFKVNTTTADAQKTPSVAVAGDGSFVVVWQSKNQDSNAEGIFGQRYDANGNTVGVEFQVNTYVTDAQLVPDVAMDATGNFVVVWQSKGQDGSAEGIYMQRYANTGAAIGVETRVNATTADAQKAPAVAMDGAGNFVVVWQSKGQDGSVEGIVGRRFDASGPGFGAEFIVNNTTANVQSVPDVAMMSTGQFVVAWQSKSQDLSGEGIYARRYDASATALGGEFIVNTTTANDQKAPTVAINSAGQFVISWQSKNQDFADGKEGIYAQQFNANGSLLRGEFLVNATVLGAQIAPSAVIKDDGSMSIFWDNTKEVFVQRFARPDLLSFSVGDGSGDATMTFSGSQDEINNALDGLKYLPGLDFSGVATITVTANDLGHSGSGGVKTTSRTITVNVAGNNDAPVLIVPAAQTTGENTVLVFSNANSNSISVADPDAGVSPLKITLTSVNGVITLSGIAGLTFTTGDGVADASMVFTGTLGAINAAFNGLSFQSPAGFVGLAGISILADDQGNSGAGGALTHSRAIYVTVAPDGVNDAPIHTVPGTQYAPVNSLVTFTSGNLIGIADDAGDNTIQVSLTATNGTFTLDVPISPEFRANTTTANAQKNTAIATAPNGANVIVWQSTNQDGDGEGIYAQRYDAFGVAKGAEFRVNTTTANNQITPAIAMDAFGNFIVVWENDSNEDGDGRGIFGQLFDGEGQKLGGEFQVNTTSSNDQIAPRVAVDASGNFVVVWQSKNQDGSGEGIFAQRFDAAGATVGDEFQVNTTTSNHQTTPRIAVNASGSFVITWQSTNQDGDGNGIYAQRYDADGQPLGSEFRVNVVTAKHQITPAVAIDDLGNFVIAWSSENQDGNGYGIYARRFSFSGPALDAADVLVNTFTNNDQIAPRVAMNAIGEYVVVWQSNNQDGSGQGTYGKWFRANGTAVGGEFRLNTVTSNDQTAPAVAIDASGAFIASWTSNGQDGSSTGVYAQRFVSPDGLVFSVGDGVADASMVFTGRLANINAALDGLVFTPTTNFNGTATLRIVTNDLGNSGSGGAKSDDDTVQLVFNTAPVLDNAGTMALTTITEDNVGNTGHTVAFIILSAGGNRITDANASPVEGIAITSLASGNGTWQYNTGGGWFDVGAVSETSALLLRETDSVRFRPNAENATAASFNFRAWDQTNGATGTKVNVSVNGGSTPFSTASETASITVTAVNDAPVLANGSLDSVATSATNPPGESIAVLFTGKFSDVDTGSSLSGIAVVGNTANAGSEGVWQYSSNSGGDWFAIAAVADNSTALALGSTTLVRFVPVASYVGTPAPLSVRALDNSYVGAFSTTAGSQARVTVDTTTNGGTTAISGPTATNLTTAITAVNNAPTISNGAVVALASTNEDTTSAGILVSAILSGASWSDPDSGAASGIAITASSGNGSWQYSTDGSTWNGVGTVTGSSALLLTSTSQLRYVPDGINGETASLSFRAWDQTSGSASTNTVRDQVNPGTGGGFTAYSSGAASASMLVTPVNDAPTIIAPASIAVTEDVSALIAGISFGDVDDTGAATFTATFSVASGSLSAVSGGGVTVGGVPNALTLSGARASINAFIAANGLSFTTAPDAAANVTLTVAIDDGGNTGADPGLSGTDTSEAASTTVTLVVSPVPDIVADVLATNEDTPITANLIIGSNGASADNFEGSPVLTAVTQGARGSVTFSGDGSVTYTPNLNFHGTDSFTYTVTSGGVTETATVTVNVTPVDDPAVIFGNRSASGLEDALAITGTLSAVDADGLTGGSVFSVTGPAANGSASIHPTSGFWSYTPNADYYGSDAFTVTVTDDDGNTATQLVSITVTPVVDIVADTLFTNEDTPVSANVITGTFGASADNFEASPVLTSVTNGANGLVTFTAAGVVTYTPNANFRGSDTFTYTVTSGGVTETGAVTVNVAQVDDPVAIGGGTSGSGAEDDGAITGTLTAIDAADGLTDGTIFSVTGAATNGSASIHPVSGLWTYTPNADYHGADSFTVTITDDDGNTATQLITITVTPVDDIVADTLSTDEDMQVTANVITGSDGASADSFEDPGGALTAVTQGSNGTVSFLANGSVTYTPNADFHGTDSFTYTVTSGGVTETATVDVTINAVNDAPVLTDLGSSINYTEGDAATLLDTSITITDVDDTHLASASVTITNFVAGDTLSLTTVGAITGSYDGAGVLTLSGVDTKANYELALESVRYRSTSVDPTVNGSALTRSLSWLVTDANSDGAGAQTSVAATSSINIAAVNDAPVATITPTSYVATEQVALTLKNTGLSISDVDAASGSMTVTLSVTEGALTVTAGGSGAVVTNSGTSSVTITGTVAQINDLLSMDGTSAVSYTNSLDVPSASATLTLLVNDNGSTGGGALSNSDTATISITAVNDAPTGAPTISGSAVEAQTLTADASGIADADGLGAFSYQWLRDGVAVSGATASTYVLGDADVGALMSVQVSYTDGQGTVESLTSGQTAMVGNVNDAPTGVPTITGTVTEDQTLTADTSGIADADGLGTFSYQWLRDAVAVSGATASMYLLGDVDVGVLMSVQVSYTDGHGTVESVTSAQTAAVANVNDAPVLSNAPVGLNAVLEDAGMPAGSAGTLVSSLVRSAGAGANVSDQDAGAGLGIAITAAAADNGTWWYSVDDGVNWAALGDVSDMSARLLAADAATRLYFQPNPDWNGTLSSALLFRAWDQSSGSNAAMADVSVAGGASAFSAAATSASLNVTPVSDAPIGRDTQVAMGAETPYVFSIADFGFVDQSDNPADALAGVFIRGLPSSGRLQVSGVMATEGQWVSAQDIAAGHLVFAPDTNANGALAVSFSFQIRDTGGTAAGGVDLDSAQRAMRMTVAAPVVRATEEPAANTPPIAAPAAPTFDVSQPATEQAASVPSPGNPSSAVAVSPVDLLGVSPRVGSIGDVFGAFLPFGQVEPVAATTGSVAAPTGTATEGSATTNLLEMFRLAFLRTAATADGGAAEAAGTASFVGISAGQVAAPATDDAQESNWFGMSPQVSATMAGVLVSAGFVSWALRAGGLLTTLLISVPAWRNVDPLPILAPEEDKPKWTSGEEQEREEAALAGLWSAGTGHDADGVAR